MKKYLKRYLPFLYILLVCYTTGCKKFADPGVLVEDYNTDTTHTFRQQRKVLLISVDALSNKIVEAPTPTVVKLLNNAKYSAVTRYTMPTNNSSSWTGMLTGNTYINNSVRDSTFFPYPNDSLNNKPVPLNLTVARYINDYTNYKSKTAVISPWNNLVNNLMVDAYKKLVTSGDEDTRSQAVNILGKENYSLTIVQFTSMMYKAGADSVNSLNKIDSYLADLLLSITNRSTYDKENWLVILTSTETSDSLINKNVFETPIIMSNRYFNKFDLYNTNPKIFPAREDIASNILYWLKIPKPTAVVNSTVWLDRFELEFLGK